jgi:hypothetical protein
MVVLAQACASGGGIGTSDPFVRGGEGATESASPLRSGERPSIDLQGTVTGGPEGTTVSDARVTLRSATGGDPEATRTGAEGTFEFASLVPGVYTVLASASGYQTVEQRIDVQGLPPVRLEIHLPAEGDDEDSASAVIRARPDHLHTISFYDRRERESGSFLLAADIQRRGVGSPRELVLSLPGFRVLTGSSVVVGRRGCPPTLFIDGLDVGDLRQINFLLSLRSIAALEAYPGSSPPARFAGLNSLCGAVVVWTPRGGS